MSLTIQISDESAAQLAQAAEHGFSVEAWVEELANEKAAMASETRTREQEAPEVIERILELQKRVKPDPEGWTLRD